MTSVPRHRSSPRLPVTSTHVRPTFLWSCREPHPRTVTTDQRDEKGTPDPRYYARGPDPDLLSRKDKRPGRSFEVSQTRDPLFCEKGTAETPPVLTPSTQLTLMRKDGGTSSLITLSPHVKTLPPSPQKVLVNKLTKTNQYV